MMALMMMHLTAFKMVWGPKIILHGWEYGLRETMIR